MHAEHHAVALVTGANRGIGREVARQLAERGYEVIAERSRRRKAEQAAAEVAAQTGGRVSALTLDVADPASIACGGRALVQADARPAGRARQQRRRRHRLGRERDRPRLRRDGPRAADELLWRLPAHGRAAPLAAASAHPRIVNVSSGMGGVTEMGGWSPGYRVSKAALNAMTRILSTELAGEGFLVNSACPGFVDTDMGAPMGATKTVQDGAAGIVWLATLPDDGPTGGFFRDRAPIAF